MERLRRRGEFRAVGRATRIAPRLCASGVASRRRTGRPPRFGFTVTKKIGNAVVRNRIRRRLREVVRLSAGEVAAKRARTMCLIGRRAALSLPFDRLVDDLRSGMAALSQNESRRRQVRDMMDNKNFLIAIALVDRGADRLAVFRRRPANRARQQQDRPSSSRRHRRRPAGRRTARAGHAERTGGPRHPPRRRRRSDRRPDPRAGAGRIAARADQTPRASPGRSICAAAGSTISASTISTRPSTRTARRSCSCRRPTPRTAISPSSAGSATTEAGALPGPDTVWTAPAGADALGRHAGDADLRQRQGLYFKRKIAVDDHYMFTVTDTVANAPAPAVDLTPYGRVTRLGEPRSRLLHPPRGPDRRLRQTKG